MISTLGLERRIVVRIVVLEFRDLGYWLGKLSISFVKWRILFVCSFYGYRVGRDKG